jgi:hypothetical protein
MYASCPLKPRRITGHLSTTDCRPNKRRKISVEVPILGAARRHAPATRRTGLVSLVKDAPHHRCSLLLGHMTLCRGGCASASSATPRVQYQACPFLQLSAHAADKRVGSCPKRRNTCAFWMRSSDALTGRPGACGSLMTFAAADAQHACTHRPTSISTPPPTQPT